MRSRHLLAVGLVAGLVAIAGCGGDDDSGDGGDQGATPPPPAATTPPPAAETAPTGPTGDTGTDTSGEGQELFASNCGTCHTLDAAGTDGQVGPNLDDLQPDKQRVLDAIANGPGVMPSNLLEGADADAVATFVSENAGQ